MSKVSIESAEMLAAVLASRGRHNSHRDVQRAADMISAMATEISEAREFMSRLEESLGAIQLCAKNCITAPGQKTVHEISTTLLHSMGAAAESGDKKAKAAKRMCHGCGHQEGYCGQC